jgi:hypothetical protein
MLSGKRRILHAAREQVQTSKEALTDYRNRAHIESFSAMQSLILKCFLWQN